MCDRCALDVSMVDMVSHKGTSLLVVYKQNENPKFVS